MVFSPLKKIILVFAATMVASLVLVDIFLHYALEYTALQRWKNEQQQLAQSISALVSDELDNAMHDLIVVSKTTAFSALPFIDRISPELNGLPENFDSEKRTLLETLRRHFSVLFVVTPAGDLYITHPFEVQRKLLRRNLADRPYLQEAARKSQPVISDSFLGADGELGIAIDVPVVDEKGGLVLHLGGFFHLPRLSQVVAKERIGRFDSAFLVDRQGFLIAHTDPARAQHPDRERYPSHPLVAPFLRSPSLASRYHQDLVKFIDPVDGRDYYGNLYRLRNGWALGLVREKQTLQMEIQPQRWRILALVATILLALSAVGVPFARQIGRRWEMAEMQVQKARDELEARVVERTSQLLQSEERLRSIINNTTSVIYLKDVEGHYLLVNRRFEQLFSWKNEELAGRTDYDIFPDHIAATLQANDRFAFEQKEAVEFEEQFPQRDGLHSYISVKFPLHDEESRIYGICGLSTDITERKNVEEDLRRIDHLKSEFIATAAHELHTPLAAIMGYSELLLSERDVRSQTAREYLQTIFAKAVLLERLVDQLLDLSHVASGLVVFLEKEPVDIAGEIRDHVIKFQRSYRYHHFISHGLANPLLLLVDRVKFLQVIDNILGNAVKFSPEGSEIVVSCTSSETEVRISIRDQGIGMTPEQVERAFHRFYRADVSETAKQGLGLGLTLAKSIIESHGGTMLLESELGKGTTVSCILSRNERED